MPPALIDLISGCRRKEDEEEEEKRGRQAKQLSRVYTCDNTETCPAQVSLFCHARGCVNTASVAQARTVCTLLSLLLRLTSICIPMRGNACTNGLTGEMREGKVERRARGYGLPSLSFHPHAIAIRSCSNNACVAPHAM